MSLVSYLQLINQSLAFLPWQQLPLLQACAVSIAAVNNDAHINKRVIRPRDGYVNGASCLGRDCSPRVITSFGRLTDGSNKTVACMPRGSRLSLLRRIWAWKALFGAHTQQRSERCETITDFLWAAGSLQLFGRVILPRHIRIANVGLRPSWLCKKRP